MRKITALVSLIALAALAVVPTTSPKLVTFQWKPDPAAFGGLSTNDYYTNILFRVLSVTNCTIPTNLWPVTTQWVASTFPSTDGVNWTNTVVADEVTRFYLIQVANQNGGFSPFSSVALWVPTPQPGTQPRILNP
jgi:hypothetical protein